MKSNILKATILAVLFMVFTNSVLFAQPIPPAPQTPIDGGLGILLTAGLFYGLKRYFRKEK